MERLLTMIALAVACAVALALPGVTAFAGYKSLKNILFTEAEINGRLVTLIVSANPELWKVEILRLEELLKRRPSDGTPERRAVYDIQGVLIAEVADTLDGWRVSSEALVFDAGLRVATLKVERSLQPLIEQTALMALLGLALGLVIYVTLKSMPLAELRRVQSRLVHEATHDALTGMPNRALFLDRLEQAMARAHRSRRPMALLFIDLDNFKDINDSRGHAVGDQVLQHVGTLLQDVLENARTPSRRNNDGAYTVARLGGDEFTAIVESAGSVNDLSRLAKRLLARLSEPLILPGGNAFVSGSIGIAMYPQDNTDRDTLLRQADMAMYEAKAKGRNTFKFFNGELNRAAQHRISLEHDLRGALERDEFLLHYQPKADLRSGAVTGVEALLRWQRPGVGLVPPDQFIGALEDTHLVVPVGSWVIETACSQLAAWDSLGLPPLSMAVNLSARQFREPTLAKQIEQVLSRTGIAAHRLELELTESLLMEDNELSREILISLARIGVRVAIDDFGTGHSSLAYLKRFKVDTLKVDRSFVIDLPSDSDNRAIASAVVALAHSLKLDVVCEGIETDAQVAFMHALGCDAIQGYLLGRPMPSDLATDWLLQYRADQGPLRQWSSASAITGVQVTSAIA